MTTNHPLSSSLRSLCLLVTLACARTEPAAQDIATIQGPKNVVRLSADANAESLVQRCLANAQGVVARYIDNEAYIAVDPRTPSRMIAVWQTQSGSGSVVQWSRSSDGGRRWTAPKAAPINECAGGPVAGGVRASDPWVAFASDGRAYISAIAFQPNPNDGPDLVSALVVVVSADGGVSWGAPVAVAIAPSRAIMHDNLAITPDPTRAGAVYAATTRSESIENVSYYGRLGFTRSDDGGSTWAPIRPITPAINRERIGAPQIVVDKRSGRLYAVYHRYRREVGSVIGVMTSDDRGDTWSAESVAAPHVEGADVRSPLTGRPFILATDIVQAAVSNSGRLIIAYSDAHRDPGGRHDVSIVWSADGKKWSAPFPVSDSTAHAWLPALATGVTDEVGVSYFAANFPANDSTARARVMLHTLHETRAGFTPIRKRLIDEARLVWPGDYQGLGAAGTSFIASYGREGDIVATRITRE